MSNRDPKSIVANFWTCASCGEKTIAVEINCGVTPFCIRCPKCGALEAHSAFYPPFPVDRNLEIEMSATHEFFRPTAEEIDAKIESERQKVLSGDYPEDFKEMIRENPESFRNDFMQHYDNGGLTIRLRTGAKPNTHELDALFKARWGECSGKGVDAYRQLEDACREELEGGRS